VFTVGEFRVMWLAELLSFMGDQLARVALAVLVYARTSSAALTGITYALTYVPTVLGAFTLSSIADRRPRREVIFVIDSVRTVVVGLMVIPGVPLWSLCVLVATMSFLGGPYRAAQLALLRDVLTREQYPTGMAVRQITTQSAQLVGFAAGGALSAALSPQFCLGVDAFTFLTSALLIRFGLRRRPAPEGGPQISITTGTKIIFSDPSRRIIMILTVLGAFFVVPQGVAAPYADALGFGPQIVGLLMASTAVGSILIITVFGRFVAPEYRIRTISVLSVLGGFPLLVCFLHPGLIVSMAVFALCNGLWAIQSVQCASTMVELLPDAQRAQGMGVAASMNTTAQGLGTALAGVVAQYTNPFMAVGLAGLAALAYAVWPSLRLTEIARKSPSSA
jgi:MFS family permease